MASLLDEVVANLAAIARDVGPAIVAEFGDDLELKFKYGLLGYRDVCDQLERQIIPITADVDIFVAEVCHACSTLWAVSSLVTALARHARSLWRW